MPSVTIPRLMATLFIVSLLAPTTQQIEFNECFMFSWLKNANATTIGCEKIPEDRPCVEPFILTEPMDDPPNVTDLEIQCEKKVCSPHTCEPDSTCVKWVQYDIRNQPLYMSLYCGKMVDTTEADNPEATLDPITNGCFTMRNGTETIEACSCTGTGCNARGMNGVSRLASADSVMIISIFIMVLTHIKTNV